MEVETNVRFKSFINIRFKQYLALADTTKAYDNVGSIFWT